MIIALAQAPELVLVYSLRIESFRFQISLEHSLTVNGVIGACYKYYFWHVR